MASGIVKLSAGPTAIPAHPFIGIDMRESPKFTQRGVLLQAQNWMPYQRGVLSKRKGSTLVTDTPWSEITGCAFGMRFYPSGGSPITLAYANRAAGDYIGSVDDTTGAFTVLSGLPVLSANKACRGVVFGEVPKAYFGNDADAILVTSDGVNIAPLSSDYTVTISIADPAVITWPGAAPANGQRFQLSTTGALPTGLLPLTTYYVIGRSGNTSQVAATLGGDAIVTSGSQSGTHTATTNVLVPEKGYMAGPFFDRPLCFTGKRVYYPRTNDPEDWSSPDTGNPQYIVVNHPEDITAVFTPGADRTDVGFAGRLYVCTPTSTWAKVLDFGATGGLFTCIHETAGIAGRNTWAWTDKGVIGMGVDNVWWFPMSGLPTPIGGPIESLIQAMADDPLIDMHLCSGSFHRGFYYLSLIRAGQVVPDVEYVADVRGVIGTGQGKYPVQWYGPMVRGNLKVGCYVPRTQRPDAQSLYALSAQDGAMMKLEDGTVYTDDGEAMTSVLETADLGGDSPNSKGFTGYSVGIYTAEQDTVTMGYEVDQGVTRGEQVHELTSEGATFDASQWDAAVFGGAGYQRIADVWPDRPDGAAVRLKVTHASAKPVAIKELSALVVPFGRLSGS